MLPGTRRAVLCRVLRINGSLFFLTLLPGMTAFGIGQDLAKSYDNLYGHLEPHFLPREIVTGEMLSPSNMLRSEKSSKASGDVSPTKPKRKYLSLEKQDECMSLVRCLLPRLQSTAAVRSAAGINDLIESGALQVTMSQMM